MNEPNYIYFIMAKNGDNNLFKIGRTKNIKDRLEKLSTGCPFPLEVCDKIRCHDTEWLEQMIHKKLEPYRLSGEWFRIPENHMLEFIKFFKELILKSAPKCKNTWFPWELPSVSNRVTRHFNLRIPEPLFLKLSYIVDGSTQSKQQYLLHLITAHVNKEIDKLNEPEVKI